MGIFSFIKEAGEKLFGQKEVEKAAAAAASDPAAQPSLDALNTTAAHAIRDYIETQNLGVTGLYVSFDGASGKVTVQGETKIDWVFALANQSPATPPAPCIVRLASNPHSNE